MGNSGQDRLAHALSRLPDLAGLPDHTAFERLTAMVIFRWLGEPAVHDVTLRGSSTAPHQIDVVAGDNGQRALIECKYYNRKIDMPVVRNFAAAVDDIGCDLAAIVTTVGFSDNVKTFAGAKGIDLLLLRETQDDDLEGRATSFRLTITAFHVGLVGCRVTQSPDASGPDERSMVADDEADVRIEYSSGRTVLFLDRYKQHHDTFGFDREDGIYPVADVFEGPTWLITGGERVPIERIDWEFRVSRSSTTSETRHEPLISLVSSDGDVLQVMSEEQLASIRFRSVPSKQ